MSTEEAPTETDAVAELAAQALKPEELDPGAIYAIPDGRGSVVLQTTDEWAETPRHTQAARIVTDAASFVSYLNRHAVAGTEVYADTPNSSVVGVIDSHEGANHEPGWQKHRLTLSLEHTKAWNAWVAHDLGQKPKAWFGQIEFAEFIEDRALDVIEPDHATMLEIALTFDAHKKADFGSAARTDNGQVRFEYTEEITGKAGAKGHLDIPRRIQLALRPYIGGTTYSVWAQFRYRISANGLLLGYALERPEVILDAAFADIVTEIRDGRTDKDATTKEETFVHAGIQGVPIFFGRP